MLDGFARRRPVQQMHVERRHSLRTRQASQRRGGGRMSEIGSSYSTSRPELLVREQRISPGLLLTRRPVQQMHVERRHSLRTRQASQRRGGGTHVRSPTRPARRTNSAAPRAGSKRRARRQTPSTLRRGRTAQRRTSGFEKDTPASRANSAAPKERSETGQKRGGDNAECRDPLTFLMLHTAHRIYIFFVNATRVRVNKY